MALGGTRLANRVAEVARKGDGAWLPQSLVLGGPMSPYPVGLVPSIDQQQETTPERLPDREGAAGSLAPFFRPRAIAVIGASRNPASIGYRLLDAVIRGGFPGPVYPVNPRASAIGGLQAFPTV